MKTEELDDLFIKMHDEGHWTWIVEDDRVDADKDHAPTHTPEGYWEYVPSIKEQFEANKDVFDVVKPQTHGHVNEKGYRVRR